MKIFTRTNLLSSFFHDGFDCSIHKFPNRKDDFREDGSHLLIFYIRISEIDGEPEYDLGYIIHADCWEQGCGAEAAEAVLKSGLDTLKLPRICANMPVHQAASRKVAIRLGMELEKEFANARNRHSQSLRFRPYDRGISGERIRLNRRPAPAGRRISRPPANWRR
ncbi:GNAT family N-acetyltransferase [Cohnella caldifontis]|uniref:GNAT family N-acetyltransferase n=1 Tax=Cohnella caldifontis TaxID=3027471 RepID=UPI003BB71344